VQEVRESVSINRKDQIEAAVVRTMKHRKTMTRTDLTKEVIELLTFPAVAADIDPRIEAMITRNFVSRDKSDPQTLHYVA